MKTRSNVIALTALALVAGLGGYQLHVARATVPTPANRIYYSGQLFSGAAPLGGSHTVKAEFYDSATAGTLTCSSTTESSDPTTGQFRLDASACDTGFKAATNVFVQLVVDGTTTIPTTGPRPRVGAAPYAVQAEQAEVATTATSVAFANVTGTNVAWPGTIDHSKITGGPTICGATTATTTGALSGYVGASTQCANLTGACAGSHQCSGAEAIQSIRRNGAPGLAAGSYWIANGAYSEVSGFPNNDCQGFTSDSSADRGPVWNVTAGVATGYPSASGCHSPWPLLCCQ